MRKYFLYCLSLTLICTGCQTSPSVKPTPANDSLAIFQPKPYVGIKHPDWVKNATIYEVNVRQFSHEGTFKAFEAHLPRLKAMGIDIIWLMPVHPIGEQNRKGSLGSYYAVKDYYAVNPEFGTMDDFKSLVQKIHDAGMHVIIDWVANHTAWDNALVTKHPDWYSRNREGKFVPTPWRDYDDIIEFDYEQAGLRQYMTNALKFWVMETNIDGFRCDVASFMPTDFWETARAALDGIKPVFMLAESENMDLHMHAFDATYAWSLWDQLHKVCHSNVGLGGLTGGFLAEHVSIWPKDAIRMSFIDNHDKNSWEGTPQQNFGASLEAAMVFSALFDGMPLVYTGQETGLDRSLKFFDRDPVEWKPHPYEGLFAKLFSLKHENPALWNGAWGGSMERIVNDHPEQVISFLRQKENHKVIGIINFSNNPVTVTLETRMDNGTYTNLFNAASIQWMQPSTRMVLAPWQYIVLHK